MTDSRQRVAMGYIKGVFGIHGWVKISADTEYPDSLLDYPEWLLSKNGTVLTATLETGRLVNGELQVKFKGIDNRDQAFSLRGYTIEIPREAFSPTEEDEYYWTDLVGMSVINSDSMILGSVTNLMETGANDVLIVEGESGQILIPFVSDYVGTIDNESKTITVNWDLDY